MEDSLIEDDDSGINIENPEEIFPDQRQKIMDYILEFEWTKFIEEVREYKEDEAITIEKSSNCEREIDRYEKELTVEFGKKKQDDHIDKDKISMICKRAFNETKKKLDEYREKRELLEKERRHLGDEEYEIERKREEYEYKRKRVEDIKRDLIEKQDDIVK